MDTDSAATTLYDEDNVDGSDGAGDTWLKGRPDPDVLPTMLAYKDGELEKTWVRVDWEVGEEGVEGLLRRSVTAPLSSQEDFLGLASGITPRQGVISILGN